MIWGFICWQKSIWLSSLTEKTKPKHHYYTVCFMRTGICYTATFVRQYTKARSHPPSSLLMPLFSLVSSLFAAVMGRHHQVAVGGEVLDVGRLAAADGGCLSLHPGDLEHAAGVVFQQVALEGLPASTNTHHHVLVVQHLRRGVGV